LLKDFLIIEYK
jgi:hypothetical protein